MCKCRCIEVKENCKCGNCLDNSCECLDNCECRCHSCSCEECKCKDCTCEEDCNCTCC